MKLDRYIIVYQLSWHDIPVLPYRQEVGKRVLYNLLLYQVHFTKFTHSYVNSYNDIKENLQKRKLEQKLTYDCNTNVYDCYSTDILYCLLSYANMSFFSTFFNGVINDESHVVIQYENVHCTFFFFQTQVYMKRLHKYKHVNTNTKNCTKVSIQIQTFANLCFILSWTIIIWSILVVLCFWVASNLVHILVLVSMFIKIFYKFICKDKIMNQI